MEVLIEESGNEGMRRGEEGMRDTIGERLVEVLKRPQDSESLESFSKAVEITKAYAGSGAVTHYSSVAGSFMIFLRCLKPAVILVRNDRS